MTQPTATGEGAVLWRQGLYGALFGCAGVILGWLAWFVVHTAYRLPLEAVLLSPFVGVVVGWVYDFAKDYRAEARALKEGAAAPADTPAQQGQGAITGVLLRRLSSAAKFGLGALVVLTLNVVGDQLSAYLRPFFISVVTFLPAGAAFTWGFALLGASDNPYEKLLRGVLVGVLATVLSVPLLLSPGIGWQEDGSFAWSYAGGLFGWWALLGIVYSFFWGSLESPNPLAPVGGAALLVVLMVVLSLVSSGRPQSNPWLKGLGYLTSLAVKHPGMPAHVVEHAEATYLERLQKEAPAEAAAELSESAWGKALAKKAVEWELCGAWMLRPEPDARAPRGELQPLQRSQTGQPRAVTLSPDVARMLMHPEISDAHLTLCRELPRGSRSNLFRSWLVLLLFSLGLGFSKMAEPHLRPGHYEGSGIQRKDRRLFWGLLAALLAAMLYIHLADRPKDSSASPPAAGEAAPKSGS